MFIETLGFTSSPMLGKQALGCIPQRLDWSDRSHSNYRISLLQCTIYVHTELLGFTRVDG